MQLIALTEAGAQLGRRICSQWPGATLNYKPKPFTELVQRWFVAGEPMLFICATGIVIRTLAPVLQDKFNDPPVLVLDEQGRFVIPLLSGHEGGANELARQIAEKIGAELVITTANPYLKPVYSVGMGCERHCPTDVLEGLLMACLQQAGLTLDQVDRIASIDLKADEVGLIELAARLGKPYDTWSVPDLRTVEDQLSTHSDYVFKTVGVYGVAESAALVSCRQLTGQAPELVLNKQKNRQATCAIARSFSNEHTHSDAARGNEERRER